MESWSNMFRLVRRSVSFCLDRLSAFLRFLLQAPSPLLSWVWRVPGVGLLCGRVRLLCLRVQNWASLPWRGGAEEPDPPGARYSSDEEGSGGDPHSGGPHSGPHRQEPPRVEVEDEVTGSECRVDETDDFYCEYDSTWETWGPENEGPPRRKSRQSRRDRNNKFARFESAARDMQNYRHDYPNLPRARHRFQEENDEKPNLSFYLGKTPSLPDMVYIDQFHKDWKGKYAKLEQTHSYIQWLFPLQEPGLNYEAKTLTKQEIQDFLGSSAARENLLKSYELMLDFYGIELKNKETGEVARAAHWFDRFQNLNNHTHNNLRITRILKCLGTLGYRHYQVPLVRFFLEETLVHGELQQVKDSALSYFLFAVLDKQERRKLLKFAYYHHDDREPFVWCPKKIQDAWPRRQQQQDQCDPGGNGWGN
ncbi:opioid growth factor receptor-like [Poeciliopsis prolifica]|uniref:opioid growth factor receptor-like n=1 Tax=Poeciliopsis prolifica TaxID=188132 RepID=UPI0024135313|nr:opioid growth factor receptor-like [Poeciliopsis prolifica]